MGNSTNNSELNIINNTQRQRFEFPVDDDFAYLEYRWYRKNLALMHTEVPRKVQGKGIAGLLAKFALDYARKNDIKIMVYCPYVAAYLKRHPEYADLVDRNYQQ